MERRKGSCTDSSREPASSPSTAVRDIVLCERDRPRDMRADSQVGGRNETTGRDEWTVSSGVIVAGARSCLAAAGDERGADRRWMLQLFEVLGRETLTVVPLTLHSLISTRPAGASTSCLSDVKSERRYIHGSGWWRVNDKNFSRYGCLSAGMPDNRWSCTLRARSGR